MKIAQPASGMLTAQPASGMLTAQPAAGTETPPQTAPQPAPRLRPPPDRPSPPPGGERAPKSRYKTRTASGRELLDGRGSGKIRPWVHNREVSRSRAEQIAANAAEAADPWFFGAPPVYLCRTTVGGEAGDTWDIIDGQHRLEALTLMERPEDYELTVVEVTVANEDEKRREFERINSGTPVPAVYWSARTRDTLEEFARMLREDFPKAAQDKSTPQRPRYNTQRVIMDMSKNIGLRDGVCAGRISAAGLREAAHRVNVEERARVAAGEYAATPKCVRGAEMTGFYLGMNKSWPALVVLCALARLD